MMMDVDQAMQELAKCVCVKTDSQGMQAFYVRYDDVVRIMQECIQEVR